MSNFTQPICSCCYSYRFPDRMPAQLQGCTDTCCDCGETTTDGIYIRVDPSTVEYPTTVET